MSNVLSTLFFLSWLRCVRNLPMFFPIGLGLKDNVVNRR